MNEVTKLYKNAGIKPYIYCSKPRLDCDARETGNCKQDCEYYSGERSLTPFTAEKQLELIKWLINEVDYITMWHFNNFKKPYDFDLGSRNSGGETFEDALAQMINNLWQDLTEEERKQIKEILE